MGDFDAKVGTKDVDTKVTGKYSLHAECNENGYLFLQFAIRNRMLIKSTYFPHKEIHLGT